MRWLLLSSITTLSIAAALGGAITTAQAGTLAYRQCGSGNVTAQGVTHTDAACWKVVVGAVGGPGGSGGGSGSLGGGGGTQTSVNTNVAADKNNSKAPPCLRVGDPIDPGTGAKVDIETDFSMPGEMGLKFERYYVSRDIHGIPNGAGGWNDNLDFEIHSICLGTGSPTCTAATFIRPDGSQIEFTQPTAAAAGAFLTGPFTEVGGGGLATLTYTPNGSGPGTYTLVDEDAMVYTWSQDMTTGAFSSNKGILTGIHDASGIGWTFTRPNSTTTVVTHTSGQQMTLVIVPGTGGAGVATLTVTDPGGNNYVYQALSGGTVSWDFIPQTLVSASFPGSNPVTIQYQYKLFDPNVRIHQGLVEVDYNGVAHDLTTYDTNGNALSTSLADGTQKTSLTYGSNATGAVVTITNPLGHVSVYQYNTSNLPISVTGQASSHCAATLSQMSYDGNGNMQSEVDNNGNTTTYQYAATGQLLQKVEASGTSIARTTTYQWDSTPGTDRLLSVTVAGLSQTLYSYNAQNRLASVSVKNLSANGMQGQTLTTTYQYTLYPNGMVHTISIIDPSPNNSDTDVYTYDALGNLVSQANGLGQTTTYSNYNALGEPGHVVGPNGDATDFTYDGRGLLLTRTTYPNGSAARWTYTYDQFGLVNSESGPDGEVTTWNRNAGGVLQTITHNDKDGTSTETFGRDAMGDVTSYTLARAGNVGLSWTAAYDELGRLYQKTGNHGQSLTYSYDGNGNVSSITNAAGHVTAYSYDALNRVTKVTESGGATVFPPSGVPSISLAATSTTGSYAVSWTAVSSATYYQLQEQVNGGAWSDAQSTGAMSWSAAGKANGNYGYQVRACNSAGCGSYSTTSSISVQLVPTTAPTLSAPASNNTGTFTVSWTGVSGAQTYALQEQANGGAWTNVQNTAATSWGTSGRGSGTYAYRVTACISLGCGPWSATSTVVVTLPPASAPGLTAPSTNHSGSYGISWTSVSAATRYELQEQINGGGWSTVQNTSAQSWNANGHATATYGYQVRGCNIGGCGPFSAVASVAVTLAPSTAPSISAPGTNGNGSFTISWNAVTDASNYVLQESVNGGGWTTVQNGSATSWSTSGRPAGTYTYQVQPYNTVGSGPWSAASTVTVNVPIGSNGQSYGAPCDIAVGKSGHAAIGFQIASGNTWQAFIVMCSTIGSGHPLVKASGSVPAAAVSVQYTWTFVGVPAGDGDAGGSISNAAASPVALSSNPVTQYTTATWPQTSPTRGRIYQLRVDFFNAIGANISSSTSTMEAETTGSP